MPTLRTDIIDVYVARPAPQRTNASFEFLQLLRASEPMNATWQPVMGHIETGETAVQCAYRELHEEIGLAPDKTLLGLWALEGVHPFFLAASDEIVLSARFAALVASDFVPRLNKEHVEHRWVVGTESFMWPGQRAAINEAVELLGEPDAAVAIALRIA